MMNSLHKGLKTLTNAQAPRLLCATALSVLIAVGCRNTARSLPDSPSASAADTHWSVAIDEDGLPNFHKVSSELYRGGQPSDDGFLRLSDLGIKTVVNAREGDSDREYVDGLPIAYEHLPCSPFTTHDHDVVRFLRLFSDNAQTPVFVHCKHGADRTGVLCAMYRVVVQGWSKDDAIIEMTRGGMRFNVVCQNLVKYVRNADVTALRQQAGITESSHTDEIVVSERAHAETLKSGS